MKKKKTESGANSQLSISILFTHHKEYKSEFSVNLNLKSESENLKLIRILVIINKNN